jgi:hypothetical protein
MGQRDAQGMGGGLEEPRIDGAGRRSEEERAQFGGQGEGHHEVGGADAVGQFPLHPLHGGRACALGTGAVVAGVEAELPGAARLTSMQVPAHDRGAAMGDGPDGAVLTRGQGRR